MLMETPKNWLNKVTNPRIDEEFNHYFFGDDEEIEEVAEKELCIMCGENEHQVTETHISDRTGKACEESYCFKCRREAIEGYHGIKKYREYYNIISVKLIKQEV